MSATSNRIIILSALLLSSTCLTSVALAEPTLSAPPPVRSFIDDRGVDLLTGGFNLKTTDLSVGSPGGGHLSYVHSFIESGWRDNLIGTITHFGTDYSVSVGATTETFTLAGSTYTSDQGTGATLTFDGTSLYTYTLSNNTKIIFDKTLGDAESIFDATDGRISSIISPNGEQVTYTYFVGNYCADGTYCESPTPVHRLQSVSNNHGYNLALGYELGGVHVIPSNLSQWRHRTSVTASNSAGLSGSFSNATYATTYSGSTSNDTITDSTSNQTNYYYDNGALIGIRRPGATSNDVTIAYDTHNRVQTVQSAAGTWTYAYADAGDTRTTTVKFTPAGGMAALIRTVTSSISLLEMTADKDANGNTVAFNYDAMGRVHIITNPEGDFITYTYDSRGNITKTVRTPKTGTSGTISTSALYPTTCSDPGVTAATCNLPENTTDQRGKVTSYSYNTATGQVLKITYPVPISGASQPQTRFLYTSLSAHYNLADAPSISMLTGISACITADAGSGCAGTSDESKTTIAYTNTGNHNLLPLTITRSSGNTSGLGAVSSATTMAFDGVGNLVSTDGPLAGSVDTTYLFYDQNRRSLGMIGPDPDGSGPLPHAATVITYNADGSTHTIARGYTTGTTQSTFTPQVTKTLSYDSAGRLIKSTGDGKTVEANYDTSGRTLCVATRVSGFTGPACTLYTGSAGPDHIANYAYDLLNRVSAVTSGYGATAPTPRTEALTYSSNGRLKTVSDGDGNLTTYGYDGYDRLINKYYPNPSSSGSSTTDYDAFAYDAASNVTQLQRHAGMYIFYTYDDLNRLTFINTSVDDSDISLSYNNLGWKTSASHASRIPPMINSFSYNSIGWLMGETGPQGTVSYQYDAGGRRSRMDWPDGLFYVTYDYDNAGRLLHIYENGNTGSGTLASYSYTNQGQRAGLTLLNGDSFTYAYDSVDRLHTQSMDLPGTGSDVSYTLDWSAAGQIIDRVSSNAAFSYGEYKNVTRPYTPNGLNRYVTVGTTSYTYDKQGDLRTDGVNTYSHDVLGHLTGVSAGGVSELALDFDPSGRLYQTIGSSTTRFVYDGSKIIAEYDASGTPGHVLRRYVHGSGADEPLVWYEGNGTADRRWLAADERGSIVAVTTGSGGGSATTLNSYDNFGIPASTNVGRFGYTGQVWLPEVGLYYYRNRMYSPQLGRFIEEDPVGNSDGLNLYAYAGNDPMSSIDPSGLDPWDITVTAKKYPDLPNVTDVPGVIEAEASGYFETAEVGDEAGVTTVTVTAHRPGRPRAPGMVGNPSPVANPNCMPASDGDPNKEAIDTAGQKIDLNALGAKLYNEANDHPLETIENVMSKTSLALVAASEVSNTINNISNGVDWKVAVSHGVGRLTGDVFWYSGGSVVGILAGAGIGAIATDGPGAVPGAVLGQEIGSSLGLIVGNSYDGDMSVTDFGNLGSDVALKLMGCS